MGQMHRGHGIELGQLQMGLFIALNKGAGEFRTRIQNGEPDLKVFSCRGDGSDCVRFTQIRLNRSNVDLILFSEVTGQLVQSRLTSRHSNDMQPVLRHLPCQLAPDARTGPGDECPWAIFGEVGRLHGCPVSLGNERAETLLPHLTCSTSISTGVHGQPHTYRPLQPIHDHNEPNIWTAQS
jgi:hypothetical protein